MKSADSVKSRLRTLASQANKPYDYILTHYFIESVLLRIAKSRYAGDFVLKGGLLLHVLFDRRALHSLSRASAGERIFQNNPS